MDPTIADDPVRAFADPPLIDDAAGLLASAPLHAIAFGFTSSSYVRGADDDAKLKARLEKRTRGIPVVVPCAAAVAAMMAQTMPHSKSVARRASSQKCGERVTKKCSCYQIATHPRRTASILCWRINPGESASKHTDCIH
jgi:hypothetical protein